MSGQHQIAPKRIEKNSNSWKIAGLIEQYYFSQDALDPTRQWAELGPLLGTITGQKGAETYGVSFDLDGGKGIEYLCGVEVSGETNPSDLSSNLVLKKLPSLTYAVFDHDGHVSEIRQTCDLIWKEWFPRSNYQTPEEADFFFERYGKQFDPEKGSGGIEIWIPINA